MTYLKAEHMGRSKWRVLAIPFGGEFKGGKDADGEFFSPRTDIKPEWFNERPTLWHHAMDPVVKDTTIGVQDDLERDDLGWWGTVWLDRASRYHAQVDKMLAAGKAFGSSGSMPHLVRKDDRTGEILVWPHIEQTITPTPINRLARIVPAKAVADFTLAGIELSPALRGLLADLETTADDLRADLSDTDGDAAAVQRLDALANALDGLRHAI